jgi:hypothetical protein
VQLSAADKIPPWYTRRHGRKECGMLRKAGALSVLAGIAVLAIHEWPNSYALNRPGVIRLIGTESRRVRVDLGRHGLTIGDVDVTRRVLFNKRITPKRIGHGEIVCTFTGGVSRICTGTFVLPRGKIVVAGTILYRELFDLAVIGGTELYENARGTLTVTSLPGNRRRDVLLFRLQP